MATPLAAIFAGGLSAVSCLPLPAVAGGGVASSEPRSLEVARQQAPLQPVASSPDEAGGFILDSSAFTDLGDQTRRKAFADRVRRCITANGLRCRYTVDVYRAKTEKGASEKGGFLAERTGSTPLPLKLVPDSVAALAALRPEDLDPSAGVFSNKPFVFTPKQWTSAGVYFKFGPDTSSLPASLPPLPSFMPHRMEREDLDLRVVARAVDWSGSLGDLVASELDGRQLQAHSRVDAKRRMFNASTAQLTPGMWTLSIGEDFSGPRVWAGVVFPLLDGNGLERGKADPLAGTRQGPYQNRVESSLMPEFSGTLLPWAVPTPWPFEALREQDRSNKPTREVLDTRRGKESICIPEQALLTATEQEKKDEIGWAVVRKAATWAPLQDDVRIDRSLDQMESALIVVLHESISEADLARVLRAASVAPLPLPPSRVR